MHNDEMLGDVLVTKETVEDEELLLNAEESEHHVHNIDQLMKLCQEDFDDHDTSPAAVRAAAIVNASITENTRTGHERVIRQFLAFRLKQDPRWDPKAVGEQTPRAITEFITQKCGSKGDGFDGRKYSTAVSIRAAITLWYRTLRPNESAEWRCDPDGTWRGLPTRSPWVSRYMIGLEKTKAQAGEASQSARALTLQDMHRLHDHCMRVNQSEADRRWGIIRWNAYLHAFLMMLRIEEVVRLTFESFNIIPGETEYEDVHLGTRKSAQTGLLHGWRNFANDRDPRMCALRAHMRLALLYGDDCDCVGPFYRRVDKVGAVTGQPVTASILSRALALDLQTLGYKAWALYGTHSFRRGGCQYRLKVKGWTIDMIAAWGGWSQVEATTMYRYVFSPTDNHEHMLEYDRNMPVAKRRRLY